MEVLIEKITNEYKYNSKRHKVRVRVMPPVEYETPRGFYMVPAKNTHLDVELE